VLLLLFILLNFQVQDVLIVAGPRQHSKSCFRSPSGPMTKFLFVARPFVCLEMGPLRRGEERRGEGEEAFVFLSRPHICCNILYGAAHHQDMRYTSLEENLGS
jgi:hypothetical protein